MAEKESDDKQSSDKQDPRQTYGRPIIILVVLFVLALALYQVHSGVPLTKLSIAGLLGVEFGQKPAPAPATQPAAAPASQPAPAPASQPAPAPASTPEASRDFVVGRWQVEQTAGQLSGETVIEYQDDGTLSGWVTQFVGGMGEKVPTEGHWSFQKRSKDSFRMSVELSNGQTQSMTFRILDQNHIQNIDENYVATRVG